MSKEVKIITHEMLKEWYACSDGYRKFCELFPEGADLDTAINGLVGSGHDEWGYWLFCRCRKHGIFKDIVARGYRNTGDCNTGNWNAGDWNTGDRNAGDRNTGHRNTGDWNTGNRNTGFFNTTTPVDILLFNKKCSREEWDKCYKPNFLFFSLTYWINECEMSDEDKAKDPGVCVRGGQLRKRDYKEAFQLSWDTSNPDDRIKVKDLPNFDAEIFYEISGIDLRV